MAIWSYADEADGRDPHVARPPNLVLTVAAWHDGTPRMDNPTARNHYLPQFYLRQFCDRSGKVLRTFRGTDDLLHEKRFVPKGTGYELDLYTLNGGGALFPARKPDLIERDVFGPIDNNGAAAFAHLLNAPPSQLSEVHKGHWAAFVNSLLERHPQRIRERDLRAERVGRETFDALKTKFQGTSASGRDLSDLVDVENLARDMHREFLVGELQNPKSIEYLRSLNLVKIALDPNPNMCFVTGDDPVVVNAGRPWPIQFLSIALTPDTLLFGQNQSELPDKETLLNLCLIHNLELFRQCEYVFSKDPLEDNELLRLRNAAQTQLRPVGWRSR